MLKGLSAIVMKNTGSTYNTLQGSFDASKGDLRLLNVTAGAGGRSYMNFLRVPDRLVVDRKGGQKTEKVDRKGGQKTREAILDMIANDAHITSTQMAERLGINRSAISKHLKKLQKKGIIRRKGPIGITAVRHHAVQNPLTRNSRSRCAGCPHSRDELRAESWISIVYTFIWAKN